MMPGSDSLAPQVCRSTNRRENLTEPEVWFRIVHIALQDQNGGPVAAYREQTVEIALGPKGAFINGNIGALTRRVATARVVSAAPPRRGKLKPPKEPKTPRVVELLRKAIEWKALLESGQIATQADIACREGITRARVNTGHGPATACAGDPRKDPHPGRHAPPSPRDRANASTHWGNRGSTRSVTEVPQVLALGAPS